jgi:hypothetical protein
VRTFLQNRGALSWLALLAICVVYVGGVWALHPTYYFGVTHDDMQYFASAKAMAEHKGYISPSLPGSPPATKYPILYPWLLSWVWRWNPSFPANLNGAVWLNVFFGLILILASYRLIRQTQGLSKPEALLLTGFFALHPLTLFYSSDLMAEIPFGALALTGLLVADRAMRRDAGMEKAIACGVLFGLTILVRTAGVPLFFGVLLAAALRRAWWQGLACAASFSPFLVALVWRSILVIRAAPYGGYSSSTPGWKQAWLYYTDYVAFRKMASPSPQVVGQLVLNQIIYLPSEVAGYFLTPLSEKSVAFWFLTTLLVSFALCIGWVRQAKYSQWAPVHFAAALYTLSLISWDYPDWQRFLLLFLPVIVAALWVQGRNWLRQVIAAARSAPVYLERVAASIVALSFVAALLAALWNYAEPSRVKWRSTAQKREMLLPEKQEAYAWLRQNAKTDERLVAMEDGSVYLYAGLQSMVPIVPSPGGIYDRNLVKSDLDHMMDVARAIHAKYWIVSADDYANSQKFFKPLLDSRSAELQSVLAPVFKSSGSHIRIYDLACVDEPEVPTCANAAQVIFPEGIPRTESANGPGLPHE